MTEPPFPPVPEIAVGTLHRSLGGCLEEVRRRGQQRLVLRRGRPVARLVRVTEARALWTLEHESAANARWRMAERLDARTRHRTVLTRQAGAERRSAFEKAVPGR